MGFYGVYGGLWGFMGVYGGFLGVPLINGGSGGRGLGGFYGVFMGVFEGSKAVGVKSA